MEPAMIEGLKRALESQILTATSTYPQKITLHYWSEYPHRSCETLLTATTSQGSIPLVDNSVIDKVVIDKVASH